jgi:hypothetical protein
LDTVYKELYIPKTLIVSRLFHTILHRGFNDEDLLNYLTEGGEKGVIFWLHERVFESPV